MTKSTNATIMEFIEKQVNEVRRDTSEIRRDMSTMRADVSLMSKEQTRHSILLDEHMRRTEAAEGNLKILKEQHEKNVDRIKPLELHVARWAGAGKLVTVIGSVAALAATILKLLHKW